MSSNLDRFMVESGLLSMDAELDGMDDALMGEALKFLRSGGAVTWDFWRDLSHRSRSAFARAQATIDGERMAAIMAVMAEAVVKSIEGATDEPRVEAAVERVMERFGG